MRPPWAVLGPVFEGPEPLEPWQVEQVEQGQGCLCGEHREWTGHVDGASLAVHGEGFGFYPNIRGIGPPLCF